MHTGINQMSCNYTGAMCLLSRLMCMCVQRSRKQSAVDVHQKGSQRQRRKSASSKVGHIIKAVHGVLML